jgi:methionyl-tRNA formyltransferase
MNIAVLTADEPLYLPAFFHRYLAARAADTRAIFTTPSRYGQDTTLAMVRKYQRAFGWWNLLALGRRTLHAKLADRLGLGRSHGRYYSLRSAANHYGVPCESVANVNDEVFLDRLRAMKTDLVVSVSCPQIFQRPLIELPALGCLNIHGALLPHYRGIAPSFWMMARGETRAGVTVFFVSERIDIGAVVESEAFTILPEETLDEFVIRSKQIHCDVLLRALEQIEHGQHNPRPLNSAGGSYFGFPTRAAYREFRRRGRRLW